MGKLDACASVCTKYSPTVDVLRDLSDHRPFIPDYTHASVNSNMFDIATLRSMALRDSPLGYSRGR